MAKPFVTATIVVTGPDLFQLAKALKVRNQSGKYDSVPMLHKLAANLANMCVREGQATVVEKMAQTMNIRQTQNKGRFPSFIQNQVKITKWGKAEDFPNISATLEVQPHTKSNRDGIPLILDILESGGLREPFKGKRLAVPVSDTTREGGTFAGKVQTRFRWDRLKQRPHYPKRGKLKGKKTIRGKSGIFSKMSREGQLTIWMRDRATKEEKLLYVLHNKPKKQKHKFDFFVAATNAMSKKCDVFFRSLISTGGDDRPHLEQFDLSQRY